MVINFGRSVRSSLARAADWPGAGPYPTPFTSHPTPVTLHPTPFTLHPAPFTLHPTHHALHLYTLHTTHTDVLELLGPRPFEMSDNYKEFVDTNHQWASRIKVFTAAKPRGSTPDCWNPYLTCGF